MNTSIKGYLVEEMEYSNWLKFLFFVFNLNYILTEMYRGGTNKL